MRLETFRIFNCFGFEDSDEINLGEPGNLVYFLGRNSSGKTSVLRAISLFAYGQVPSEHPKFANYEPSETTSHLRARFLVDPCSSQTVSVDTLLDSVVEVSLGNAPWQIERGATGFSISLNSPGSSPGTIEAVALLDYLHEVYSELIEVMQASGQVWVTKFGNGTYAFSTVEGNYNDFVDRRQEIKTQIATVNSAITSGGHAFGFGMSFEQIEGLLFQLQFPEIFFFTDRFSLDQDLPRSLRGDHLQGGQNALTEAFIALLDQETLRHLMTAKRMARIKALTDELQGRLDALCDKINEDAAQGSADEGFIRIHVQGTDNVRIILVVDDKESYYEHLSDNTKFLIAYHVFEENRERAGSPNSILLFDEPNQGFHPTAEAKMLRFLESLAENGNQVLLATHSQYMIDTDRLSAIRVMGGAEDGTLRVSNGIYRPASPGGDMLALQPVTEAIGLHYAEQLVVKDKVIVTEGYTDMLYLRAFKRMLGHQADLNLAPVRGESQIPQFIPFLISQGMSFKIVLDSRTVKKDIQRGYPIPDACFFTVPAPADVDPKYGLGVEDMVTKADFRHLLERYGWIVNEEKLTNVSNSNYAKQEKIKTDLATKVYADEGLDSSFFEDQTSEAFGRALDFCASDPWFRA